MDLRKVAELDKLTSGQRSALIKQLTEIRKADEQLPALRAAHDSTAPAAAGFRSIPRGTGGGGRFCDSFTVEVVNGFTVTEKRFYNATFYDARR